MNLLKNKKHTEIRKETAPLKMKRGQKKLFALYPVVVSPPLQTYWRGFGM